MSSLADFGVAARDVVRQLTTDRDGLVVCPECGTPIGGTKGSQELVNPELVNADDLEVGTFVTLGWRCEKHAYDVVIPKPSHGENAHHLVPDLLFRIAG